MSKSELKHDLKSEIKKVNKVIDQKITRGLPYVREARYHKLLRARLAVLRGSSFLAQLKKVTAIF